MLRKEDIDWVKECMEYEVLGSRPRGRPKRTWIEVVQKDCQARKLNRDIAIDRNRWKKVIKKADIPLNTIGRFGDVPQANLLAWYGKTKPNTTKARIHQSKQMY